MKTYNPVMTRNKALVEGGSVAGIGSVVGTLVIWLAPDLDEETQLAIIGVATSLLTAGWKAFRNWRKNK